MTNGSDARLSARAALRVGLVWAMGLLAVAFTAGLALRSAGLIPVADGWFDLVVNHGLGQLTEWVPAAVCWLAVFRFGFRRWEVPLAAAAVTSYAVGNAYYLVMLAGAGSLPFPSLGDVAYLLFYPLMLAAVVVAVSRRSQGLASSVWLDAAVGSLGAAAVLAIVLSPVLAAALKGPPSLASVVAVAYPMFDLMLVAAIAGIVALGGVRLGSRWPLLVVGLMVFAALDVVYALQVTAGTYVVGTPLDAGWAIGLTLMAMWVDGTERRERPATHKTRPATGATALVVSSVATVAGLGVLVVGTWVPLSRLAVTLAGATLLAAAARTQLAFRQVLRMADLRRQAMTDHLTGLPNRRNLYVDGQARLLESPRCRRALLLLDLDKFKEINDSLGHHAGDQLLIHVGARLRERVRGGDLLARLGGDEFAVLLKDAGHDEAVDVAVMLRAALAEPFALEDITLHSSVSIGIALFPDDGPDLSSLLRKADIAMYKAKASGVGHHAYSGTDDADGATRLRMVEVGSTARRGACLSAGPFPCGLPPNPACPFRGTGLSSDRTQDTQHRFGVLHFADLP